MAGNSLDINAALVRRVSELSADAFAALQKKQGKAPLMHSFLQFLQQQKSGKFKTHEAVAHLYQIKKSQSNYALFENRFFKLRKKLFSEVQGSATITHDLFTPQEIALHEIKSLTISGKHQEANALFPALEKKLWDENIFELLPELLELAVFNNQMQRKNQENVAIYQRMELAAALYTDLFEAKKMARQIYDTNITAGVKDAAPLFVKLQRLSIQRKQYPRFKLIYNLISATCKMGGGGLDFIPDFKITSRFISVINQIHTLHPNMPDYRFITGYTDTQNYLFQHLKVMNYFNAFHFKEAAVLMKQLYDSVVEENSPLQRMKGNVLYSSTCQVLVMGEQHLDLLEVANSYLKFLRETNQNDKLMNAYIEIINAHIWLHPHPSGYTPAFIKEKLEQYAGTIKKNEYRHYYMGQVNWLKIKLCLINNDYKQAKSILDKADFSSYFMDANLGPQVVEALQTLSVVPFDRKKAEGQINQLRLFRLNTKLPPDYINFRFLEKLLSRKLKE